MKEDREGGDEGGGEGSDEGVMKDETVGGFCFLTDGHLRLQSCFGD